LGVPVGMLIAFGGLGVALQAEPQRRQHPRPYGPRLDARLRSTPPPGCGSTWSSTPTTTSDLPASLGPPMPFSRASRPGSESESFLLVRLAL
jgi:hypothetical protein